MESFITIDSLSVLNKILDFSLVFPKLIPCITNKSPTFALVADFSLGIKVWIVGTVDNGFSNKATGTEVAFAKNTGFDLVSFVPTKTNPSWMLAGRTSLISVSLQEM